MIFSKMDKWETININNEYRVEYYIHYDCFNNQIYAFIYNTKDKRTIYIILEQEELNNCNFRFLKDVNYFMLDIFFRSSKLVIKYAK